MPGTYLPLDYLPVLMFLMVATAFGIGSLLIGELLRLKRSYSRLLVEVERGTKIPLPNGNNSLSLSAGAE